MSNDRTKKIEELGYDIPTDDEMVYKKIQSCRIAFANFICFTYEKLIKNKTPFLESKDYKTLGLSNFTVNEFIKYCQEKNVVAVIKKGNSVREVYLPTTDGEYLLEKWRYFCYKKLRSMSFSFNDFMNYDKNKQNKKLGEFTEKAESDKK
jgi:hypothetical protein